MGICSLIYKLRWEVSPINRCYSQEGEEKILERLFKGKNDGFYVDCGANHPIRYSNTYKLYLKGWRGIIIDALPGTEKIYRHIRPRDIVVESGVGEKATELTYYSFKESAYNTFNEKIAQERINNRVCELKNKQVIPIRTLGSIFDEYLGPDSQIDVLDVDIEGMDYVILKSNDWGKRRPLSVCVEVDCGLGILGIEEIQESNIGKLMEDNGYLLLSRLWHTAIFVDKDHQWKL